MNQNNKFKWLAVIFITAWAIYSFYPPSGRPLLQQFEQMASNKDTNFTAIVTQAKALEKDFPNREYGNLTIAISTNDITKYFPSIKVQPPEKEHTRQILNKVQRQAQGKIKLGLDLQGGTSFLVGVDTSKISTNVAAADRSSILEQAIEVLRSRVDKFGVAEPILQPQGENRILIQLPGLSEAEIESARRQIEKPAFLEFRMVHPESDQLLAQGLTAPGYEKLFQIDKDKNGQISTHPFLVKKGAEKGLTGKYVERASVSRDQLSNIPEINLRFDGTGAELFGQITKANVNRRLAIVLDGELKSAPNITEPILGGNARISGGMTDIKEAFELSNVLENPLETPVKVEEQRGVGPSLGKDSIESGVRSAVYGVIAVAIFMLVYYMLAGFVANIALILNIIILLGVLCSVGTTLTLPGIAGIVLTIGMAVDANVLIYERIREELEAGKSIRGALSAGYGKAFGTIFDSNLTTLIASVILIFMGTGPVKGFGVTLTIGVCVSMFTALIVTRLIFDWMLARDKIKSIKMLHLVKGAHFDFMKWAKPAFALSWLLIIVGLGYGISRGKHMLGVDFAGGDQLTLSFAQRVDEQKIRDAINKADIKDATPNYQQGVLDNKSSLIVTSPYDTGLKVEETLKSSFPEAKFQRVAFDKVGPSVGQEILRTALMASILAMFGILIYVAFRYEFSFAVAAVVAILHDILMTLGWFALTGREFNAPIVAAILTIIGFSINDTIVIFDRIREDLKLGIRGTFREIMNRALNQTLSRTIITSGTVFLATASLYLFGGGVINDFAFTFLVGIVTGTYSSIYIASALVLWWHKGQRPNLGATSSASAIDNSVTARV